MPFAFGIEISLNEISVIENCIYLRNILMLRMIQDAFSLPYIIAKIRPLLKNNNRPTFLYMQSFSSSILFAITLYGDAKHRGGTSYLAYDLLQPILKV